MSSEEKFLSELNIFRNEVLATLKFLYTELAIHEIKNKDKKVLFALNNSPTFWNTVLSALQHSTFITLGRIFDNNGKSTITTLIKVVKKNKNIFTKDSFRERWIKNSDKSKIDHWLPEYLKTVYIPLDKDFEKLSDFIDRQKQIYKKNYKPIRNHFGHKIYVTNEEVKAVFDEVQIRDLEKFCVTLLGIHEALWQLYHNGRGPLLPIKQGKYSTKGILKRKYKPYDSKPANAQFVEEVARVLNILKIPLSKNQS